MFQHRNNIYYNNNQKVRASCPISFQTTSLKAQYQLRAGVFNFPKKSPANNNFNNNNNLKKNDFRQCTNRIRQIQKDVQLKDKTSVKRRGPLRHEPEKKSYSTSTQYSNELPSKTKTEANIDVFTESSCKPRGFKHDNKRKIPSNPKQYSASNQYSSDYSYSTYSYTYLEISSQGENSENKYDSYKKNNQQQSSITLSDHLSSGVIARKAVNLNSDVDENNSDIKVNDYSNSNMSNNSDSDIVHHKSTDMKLSDMDSITITADNAVIENSSQKKHSSKSAQNSSSRGKSEKSNSLKHSKEQDKKEKLTSTEHKNDENVEIEDDYSKLTGKSGEVILSDNYSQDQSQMASQKKNESNQIDQQNEENKFDIIQEEEELSESSSQIKNENLENENEFEQLNENENIKNRSIKISNDSRNDGGYDNNNDQYDIDSQNETDNKNSNEGEKRPVFKALLEANQKLVSAVLKNQEALLNIVENEYTKKALEHLHEAVTLLDSVEAK